MPEHHRQHRGLPPRESAGFHPGQVSRSIPRSPPREQWRAPTPRAENVSATIAEIFSLMNASCAFQVCLEFLVGFFDGYVGSARLQRTAAFAFAHDLFLDDQMIVERIDHF